jgi:hypothetical protein
MGRGSVIFGFWLLGYALGFLIYIARAPFLDGIISLFGSANADVVGGLLSGFAGSVLMLAFVFLWSRTGNEA